VLLPVAGAAMVDYTLEWLAMAGVEETFVFCCAHSQQIRAHLEDAGWMRPSSSSHHQGGGGQRHGMRVSTVVAHDCVSVGDALRHMDHKGVIRGDFILVSGDVIANVSLTHALHAHRERRRKDKQAVMTMLLTHCPSNPLTHLTRTGSESQVFGICPDSNQLLFYEPPPDPLSSTGTGKLAALAGGRRSLAVSVERAVWQGHRRLALRTDLEDSGIDICAPEVLYLYTDNFDYQHPRRDFLRGILNDDIMGNKIFTHEIKSQYAARIDTLRAYAAVSRDVLRRWAFPLAPDCAFGAHSGRTAVTRGNRYREEALCAGVALFDTRFSLALSFLHCPHPLLPSTPPCPPSSPMPPCPSAAVSVARSAVIGPDTLLGEGTVVAERAVVRGSVLGAHCLVGEGAVVDGSFLWGGVTVGAGAVVRHAVLCDGVQVMAEGTVHPGCVLSFDVVVAANHVVPAGTRIAREQQPEEEGSDDENTEGHGMAPPAVRRKQGKQGDEEDEDDEEEEDEEEEDEEEGEEEKQELSDEDEGPCDVQAVGEGGRGFAWPPRTPAAAAVVRRQSLAPITALELAELARLAIGREEGEGEEGEEELGREGGAALVGGEEEEEEDEEEEDGEDEFSKEVSCVGWRGGGKGGGGDVGERRWGEGWEGWDTRVAGRWRGEKGGKCNEGGKRERGCKARAMHAHWGLVEEMFKRAVAEGVAQDNVVLEVNALKLAYNRSFADCAGAMFRGMLNLAASQAAPGAPTKELLASTRAVVTRWTSLLRRFLKGTDDEVEVLLTFEEVCNESRPEFAPIFVNVLEALYDRDIVSEEAVMAWADEKQFADAADKVFVERSAAFIKCECVWDWGSVSVCVGLGQCECVCGTGACECVWDWGSVSVCVGLGQCECVWDWGSVSVCGTGAVVSVCVGVGQCECVWDLGSVSVCGTGAVVSVCVGLKQCECGWDWGSVSVCVGLGQCECVWDLGSVSVCGTGAVVSVCVGLGQCECGWDWGSVSVGGTGAVVSVCVGLGQCECGWDWGSVSVCVGLGQCECVWDWGSVSVCGTGAVVSVCVGLGQCECVCGTRAVSVGGTGAVVSVCVGLGQCECGWDWGSVSVGGTGAVVSVCVGLGQCECGWDWGSVSVCVGLGQCECVWDWGSVSVCGTGAVVSVCVGLGSVSVCVGLGQCECGWDWGSVSVCVGLGQCECVCGTGAV
ncbi:unnamed protein product, partial [Closterium sp. NIES-65]